jgi:hypothetical protein
MPVKPHKIAIRRELPPINEVERKVTAFIRQCRKNTDANGVPTPVTILNVCLHLGMRRSELKKLAEESAEWSNLYEYLLEVAEEYWQQRMIAAKDDSNAKFALEVLHGWQKKAPQKDPETPDNKPKTLPGIILGDQIPPPMGEEDEEP